MNEILAGLDKNSFFIMIITQSFNRHCLFLVQRLLILSKLKYFVSFDIFLLGNPILQFSILPYSAVVTEVLMQAKFCHSLFCFRILSNHGCRTKDKLCYPDNFRKILHIVHPRGAQLVSNTVPCKKCNNLFWSGEMISWLLFLNGTKKMEHMIGPADQSQV